MLTTHLHLVFVLIWALFLSNWLTSLLGLAFINPLTRITTIRTHLIIPIILTVATVGAYVYRGRIEDVFAAFLFALIGYSMKKFGWPRIPLVIALVLGPLFENNFHLTLRLQQLGRINFFARPIVLILIGLSLISLVLSFKPIARTGRK
jgi:putative tricarboxylic transport membrane protein